MVFWEFYRRNPTLFMIIVVIYISVIIIMSMIILFLDGRRKEDFDGERREDEADIGKS